MKPDRQKDYAQLAIRDSLIMQGMDPADAEREAGRRVLQAAQEAAVSYGNGADVDNLAAADTPFEMDVSVAVPQGARVFRDDPTRGMAAQVAAREAAAAADWEQRGAYYGPKEATLAATFGPAGAANDAVTEDQLNARLRRREAEEVQRHSSFEEEQRIARMAKRAGLTIEDARALVQQGYDQAAEARGIPPGAAWQASGQNRTVPPDFDQFRDAYSGLRDAAKNRRMADEAARKTEVAKRAQLAQNPMGYLGRNDITEEQRELVAQRLQGRRRPGDDPRIRVAEIQAKAGVDQAAAERESRISQQQWLENTRIAAEERAATRAEANALAQREFDAEQKALDRTARASEGDAAREEAAALRQADLDERRRQHDELMQRMAAQEAEAARRHEAAQATGQQQFDAQMKQFEARYGLDERKLDQAKQEAEDLRARLESEAILKPMEAKYGEGVRAIAAGDYESPEAERTLQRMAAASDQSWTGFFPSDAQRMDAILARLGMSDAAARQRLVSIYGTGRNWDKGDRGRRGLFSDIYYGLYGDPSYSDPQ